MAAKLEIEKRATKVWLELTQWFLKRRFLCEFPIGFYVKLSSAVGAILVEGPNLWTHFWKTTIKNVWHIKIYQPCNFEVYLITHLGVIALFS
jgi:hypothetical protein